ncbi:MAG: hypothetical protein ACMG5Z_05340 [Luteimonas sp.]
MATMLLALVPVAARCQGGPPLITNDPDTPGDGHWEINLAATGARAAGTWQFAIPDIDVNYGLGERIQLSLHAPWMHLRDNGGGWSAGLGAIELAARWRFLDQEQAGVSVAIQPHWASSWSTAAVRRGLAPAGDEFALPVQVAHDFGTAVVGVEVGRNFLEHERDDEQAGLFMARDCPAQLQCLAELNTTWPATDNATTLLNLGLRRPVGEHLVVLASAGCELGGGTERQKLLFYLGVQLLR